MSGFAAIPFSKKNPVSRLQNHADAEESDPLNPEKFSKKSYQIWDLT